MDFGIWHRMFDFLENNFELKIEDIEDFHKNKLFTTPLNVLYRGFLTDFLESLWFFFESDNPEMMYQVKVMINARKKLYTVEQPIALHCKQKHSVQGFEIRNISDEYKTNQLEKEVRAFLKNMPSERLKLLLGWELISEY
jgi:hypothetical protein